MWWPFLVTNPWLREGHHDLTKSRRIMKALLKSTRALFTSLWDRKEIYGQRIQKVSGGQK
jgi:hypothetical protein